MGLVKAVALTCPQCSGRLLAAPGIPLGVCNPCSLGCDFATGEKKQLPVLEAVVESGGDSLRLPFIRFEAAGGGDRSLVYVMAFAISKIGTPYDDGSKLTVEAREISTRPGRLDVAPALGIETAAGLARFLALRRLDPDAKLNLRPQAVSLSAPSILAMPFRVNGDTLVDPISGMTEQRKSLDGAT
ncbi:MAG: hypothetical protein HY049_19420 [Acidobacteria bacterium]|nr:hypothetical protein [Acidobacteriota bacterium]